MLRSPTDASKVCGVEEVLQSPSIFSWTLSQERLFLSCRKQGIFVVRGGSVVQINVRFVVSSGSLALNDRLEQNLRVLWLGWSSTATVATAAPCVMVASRTRMHLHRSQRGLFFWKGGFVIQYYKIQVEKAQCLNPEIHCRVPFCEVRKRPKTILGEPIAPRLFVQLLGCFF
jgi:hypothetical protein